MKLVPLFDKVVLKQLVAEETTASGIVLPGAAKEKPQQAEVIAVGPGGVVDGKEVTMQVKAGDKVIYSKYSGTEVELEKEKYVIVKQLSLIHIFLIITCSKSYDHYILCVFPLQCTDRAGCLKPIHYRHYQIHQDHRYLSLCRCFKTFQCFFSIPRSYYIHPFFAQDKFCNLHVQFIVLYQKYLSSYDRN